MLLNLKLLIISAITITQTLAPALTLTQEPQRKKTLLPLKSHSRSPEHLHPAKDESVPLHHQRDLIHLPEEEKRELEWELQIVYENQTFFDGWDFFSAPDPSHGLVQYVDHDTAFRDGLAFWTEDGVPGIQVEHWSTLPPNTPRQSTRISSKALFASGLFVIDLQLMPWGCGVWPAFWMLGYEAPWPETGEIDIIEGVQGMTRNQMTIHTTPGCVTNTSSSLFSGTPGNTNCDSTTGGSGCSITSPNPSHGQPFNKAGGGVFACLWDGTGIRMWDWNRSSIPADLKQENPQPSTWGKPVAAWDASTCSPYTFFQAQELILNINLCGDWAGSSTFPQYGCPGTCGEYISDPTHLMNTVMLINYIKVFQQSGSVPTQNQAATNGNQTGAGGAVAVDQKQSSALGGLDLGWRFAMGIVGLVLWLLCSPVIVML